MAILPLTGCPRSGQEIADPVPADAFLPLRIDGVDLTAQIALSRPEQINGLMHRTSLPADGGMLFPYQQPQRLTFWMANTPLPLDIGFFDSAGILREIHRMQPFDTTRTVSRSDDLRFALEMESGWFRDKGIGPGAQLDLRLLADAMRRRGADPRVYGITGD